MFILIDMDQCAITHKHRSREVLNMLAWIECKCAAKVLPLGNPRHISDALTPLEMQMVYKNATGQELKAYGNIMATVLHEMAKRMPDTKCNPEEVEKQAWCVLPADPASYRYAPGAHKPEHLPGLFQREPIKVVADAGEVALAAQTAATYAQHASANPPPAPRAPMAGGSPTPAAPRAPRAPSAPRQGGTKSVVFSVADEMWKAAGSPTDTATVLRLRKDIMGALERDHNVKRTTSSVTLGDWQKQLGSI